MDQHLSSLNDAQRQAVLTTKGPLLVIAGAGAGKTRTIAYRILNLVKSGVKPEEILAITFTNKAAGEMAERIRSLLGVGQGAGPTISTFHSLCVRLLREFHAAAGVPRSFVIYDRDDSKKAVREVLESLGLDPKRFEPAKVLSAISRAKGDGKTPDEFARNVRDSFSQTAARVWPHYEAKLAVDAALDFDDLLARTARLFTEKREVLDTLHRRWKYLHVDEYQDTNRIQYNITRALVGPERNICVVGDSDQSIYGWRGADIRNILEFEEDFPNAAVVLLEQNYRSTKTILAAAASVIEKNRKRKEKRLFTENADGEKAGLYVAYDEEDEARFIARKVSSYLRRGVPPTEIAVLYRANFQSRVMEQAFLEEGVDYQLVGTRFFERKEVKDALSYLRLALSGERGGDLVRALAAPPRGIGKVSVLAILSGKESELSPAAARRLADFREMVAEINAFASSHKTSETVRFAAERSGLMEYLRTGKGADADRLENLKELVTVAARYDSYPGREGVERMLENAALMSDQDELAEESASGVKLMTVHAAKGLEFDVVFVAGLEEGLFPHGDGTESEDKLEEERRLAYVAITRARKKLILSYASVRTIFGLRSGTVPSQFLSDIPDELLEAEQGDSDGFKTVYL